MICEDVASTGLLGRPSEYFSGIVDNFQNVNDPDQLKLDFEKSLNKGYVPASDSLSVKIMQSQIGVLGKILLDSGLVQGDSHKKAFCDYFKDFLWVRIFRDDKVAQAVSRIFAKHTNVYHQVSEDSEVKDLLGKFSVKNRDDSKLKYSYDEIDAEVRKIEEEERFLTDLINDFNMNVYEIKYEDSVKSRNYIYEVASLLKLESNGIVLKDRSLKKISGELAGKWIEKYKNEVLGK